ncbi:hypothetical protein RCXUPER_55 [Rhodobacter phage RcXuper]|nr:hypothetical protein RCXUPER_55 [Rhodobacter phage RcXuper]
MGFKSLIAKQVQGAMRILGTDADGLARPHTLVSVDPDGTYDFDSREMTHAETAYPDIPMSMVRFKIDDMDAEVRPKTDRRALVASLDIPVVPTEKDYVLDPDGTRWTVVRLLSDPADALVILHLRRE